MLTTHHRSVLEQKNPNVCKMEEAEEGDKEASKKAAGMFLLQPNF